MPLAAVGCHLGIGDLGHEFRLYPLSKAGDVAWDRREGTLVEEPLHKLREDRVAHRLSEPGAHTAAIDPLAVYVAGEDQ